MCACIYICIVFMCVYICVCLYSCVYVYVDIFKVIKMFVGLVWVLDSLLGLVKVSRRRWILMIGLVLDKLGEGVGMRKGLGVRCR